MTRRFEVTHYTLQRGWINSWTVYKDRLRESYDSQSEAQSALRAFLKKTPRYAEDEVRIRKVSR